MKLENWCVIFGEEVTPYTPPELIRQHLHGEVYGHPKHKDGTKVTTTHITAIAHETVYTFSGGVYELGEVLPDYEEKFPNARERLFSGEC